MLTVLDLFSGIGGFSLGLERTGGFKTIAFCEIDPFCRKVLAKHWPDVPIYEDVTCLPAEWIGEVDVICGGFPCQPFSTASRGRRVAKDMWPAMQRLVYDLNPRVVIAENVARKPISRAASDVIAETRTTAIRNISAGYCGADHKRSRWWMVAHPYQSGEFHRLIDAEVARLPKLCEGVWGASNYSRVLRVPHGVSNRVDRIRALGNAVVPQIPEIIGRAILAAEAEMKEVG